MKKKPIREWLETIADPTIREAAISQIDENWYHWPKNGMVKRLADALFHFNDWEATKEGYVCWDEIQNKAQKGQLETREVEAPEMKEGYIPYSNEQEREWAIAQAERMGAKEWKINLKYKATQDSFIYVGKEVCSGYHIWLDENDYDPNFNTLIPLERPEEATKLKELGEEIKENHEAFTYAWNSNKYTKTEQEDGTIILKPKKKKVKVWIEVYEEDGKVKSRMSYSKDELDHYMSGAGYYAKMKHLEVIEREYEI